MKRIVSITLIISVAALFMTSCTMEKRMYRPGYHVDWNKNESYENNTASLKQSPAPLNFNETLPAEENAPVALAINDNSGNEPNRIADVITVRPVNARTITSINETPIQPAQQQAPKISLKRNNPSVLMAPFAKKMGGDNQIVALLLCFFLGMLGVHSFYLGNKKKGIIQLVLCIVGFITFPFIIGIPIIIGLSIWVLIDFIRIIIGDLGPGW